MNPPFTQNNILRKKNTCVKTISCIRNFTINCNIFGNYIAKIDIIKNNSMESIIKEFVIKLKNDLSKLNLTSLIIKLEDLPFALEIIAGVTSLILLFNASFLRIGINPSI